MANSVSIFVPQTLWGQGTSSPKFKHPDGTYSAVSEGPQDTIIE